MDRIKFIRVLGLALIFMFILGVALPTAAHAQDRKPINHVFLISVGGLNQEGYTGNPLPNLKYLMVDGTFCEKTLAVRSDTMEAAEATLLTGALDSEHKHLTVDDRVEVESILDVLKRNGRSMLVVDGSGGKLNTFAYGDKEYRQLEAQATSKDIFAEAAKSFNQHKPFFSYIYIDDCSEALLRMDQDDYYQVIKNFDAQLGVFLQGLRDSGVYGNSLIIVTSARSSSPSNMVPLIIYGPGVKINASISGAMVIDVASTICRLIGIESPSASRGIPLYGSFIVADDTGQTLNNRWIKDLQKDRQANWTMNYRLEDELNRTTRLMASIKEEKQSIFDFAGEREQMLIGLKTKMTMERFIWIGLVLLLLGGYAAQYLLLKRKYLLFK